MDTATDRLRRLLGDLPSPFDNLSDGGLLARFVTTRDEAAFAALVRRHGPMVLGVCRRALRHTQDAEDAFQATFWVLARKAGSVRRRAALGSWLYRVAQRTAQEARAMRARHRAKERPLDAAPEAPARAAQAQDWGPWLDQELSRLPEKYRAAIVLCDLEARPRKDAARQLGIPEGTLSSRLANGRKLLAARLARRGVTLGGGALAAALAEGVASAQVPWPLARSTARAAASAAAVPLATAATPVALLVKGVLRTMLMARLKLAAGLFALAALALGFGGVAYERVAAQGTPPASRTAGKPLGELEALRKENELLRLNLQVVLEKVRAQEAEIRALKDRVAVMRLGDRVPVVRDGDSQGIVDLVVRLPETDRPAASSVDDALKRLREAKTDAAKRQAVEALEQAVQRLRQELQRKTSPDTVGPENDGRRP
jgi:RNA polymerase sigma factor (sigma-70 family)